MVEKVIFIAAVTLVLISAGLTQARVGIVRNGSFENDANVPDITAEAPRYWCDVNMPPDTFSGWIDTDWSTNGYGDHRRSLTLSSQAFATFAEGDIATLSQPVYLADVNQIIFDIKLDTISSQIPWDPQRRSAVLLIDDNLVWESNSIGPDVKGEYLDVIIDVNETYKDANSHTLSLGIRANADETSYVEYYAQWDFVKFNTHCAGLGYLPEDLNRDSRVNMLDFALLAGNWFAEEPVYQYGVDNDGIVDEFDLKLIADVWLNERSCEDWHDPNEYFWNDPNLEQFHLLDSDLNDDGIVDLRDFAILANDYDPNSPIENDCARTNLERDDRVDMKDFSILKEDWLLKSWLYGLD